MKRLKGTLTNREIILFVFIVYTAAAITGFQWRGFVLGSCAALAVMLIAGRKLLNTRFERVRK